MGARKRFLRQADGASMWKKYLLRKKLGEKACERKDAQRNKEKRLTRRAPATAGKLRHGKHREEAAGKLRRRANPGPGEALAHRGGVNAAPTRAPERAAGLPDKNHRDARDAPPCATADAQKQTNGNAKHGEHRDTEDTKEETAGPRQKSRSLAPIQSIGVPSDQARRDANGALRLCPGQAG